ncbi:MAG: Ig-like domain repeat protein [Thermoplasmatota archaeon]
MVTRVHHLLAALMLLALFQYPALDGRGISDDPLLEDIHPPSLLWLSISGNMTTGDPFTVYANVTDDVGVDSVWIIFNWSRTPSSWNNRSMTGVHGNYSITLINPLNRTDDFWYMIQANDTSNNWMSSGLSKKSVTDNDPPVFLYDGSPPNATTGDPFLFTAVMDDNIGITNVTLNITYNFLRIYIYNMSGTGNTRQRAIMLPSDITGTLYYWFRFKDGAGNVNESSLLERKFIDNDAPVLHEDLTSGPATTGEWFNIAFVADDNWGIDWAWVNYEMLGRKDSAPVNYTLGRSGRNFTHSIRMPQDWAGKMNYNASFMDAAGNLMRTENGTIDTLDNDPPGLSRDLTNRIGTTGEDVTFSVLPKDNIGVSGVVLEYSVYGGGATTAYMRKEASSGLYNHTVRAPSSSEGVYEYSFRITDTSGNEYVSSPQLVHIFDNDPPYLIYDESDEFAMTGEMFTFRTVFSDNVEVHEALVEFGLSGGGGSLAMRPIAGGEGSGDLGISLSIPEDAEGDITYRFIARDERMNDYVSDWFEAPIFDTILPEIVDVRFVDNRTSETSGSLTTGDVYIIEVLVRDNIDASWVDFRCWTPGNVFEFDGRMSRGLKFEDRRTFYTRLTIPSNYTGEFRYEVTASDSGASGLVSESGSIEIHDDDPPVVWNLTYEEPIPLFGYLIFGFHASDNIGITEAFVNFTQDGSTLEAEHIGSGLYIVETWYLIPTLSGLRLQVIASDGTHETRVPVVIRTYDNLPPTVESSIVEGSRYPDASSILVLLHIFDHSGWNISTIEVVKDEAGFEVVDYDVSANLVTFTIFPTEPGLWRLQVLVEDSLGHFRYLQRNFTVYDNTPPYFQISVPGTVFKGETVNLSVIDVNDSSEITWIEWTIEGPGGELYTFLDSRSVQFKVKTAGSYQVKVLLRDRVGNGQEKSVWFNVEEKADDEGGGVNWPVIILLVLTALVGLGVLFLTFKDRLLGYLGKTEGGDLSTNDQ